MGMLLRLEFERNRDSFRLSDGLLRCVRDWCRACAILNSDCGASVMESGRGVGPGDGVVEFPLAKGLFRTRDGPFGAGALMVGVAGASSLLFRVDVAHYAGNAEDAVWEGTSAETKKSQTIRNYVQ
jgi:hypothetical protein